MPPTTPKTHKHEYKTGRGSVNVCACGRFQHKDASNAVVEIKLASHTPTPWEVGEVIDSRYPKHHTVYINIRGSKGERIAALSVYGKPLDSPQKYQQELGERRPIPNISDAEADANAAFIVRAVNAHDELVQTLRDVMHNIDYHHGICGELHCRLCDAYNDAKEVLTRAEKGE